MDDKIVSTQSNQLPPVASRWDTDTTSTSDQPDENGSGAQKCPICLRANVVDASKSDKCMHVFCFVCICEWAKIKLSCPLCKTEFSEIRHKIESDNSYSVFRPEPPVEPRERRRRLAAIMTSEQQELQRTVRALQISIEGLPPSVDTNTRPVDARTSYGGMLSNELPRAANASSPTAYRGRSPRATTDSPDAGVDDEVATSSGVVGNGDDVFVMHDDARSRERRAYERYSRLLQTSESMSRQAFMGHSDFRRLVYERNLCAQRLTGTQTGYRIRDCSPEFFSRNGDAIVRLIPFMKRDLKVLLCRDRAHITATLESLVDWLKRYPIDDDSGIMYTMLYPILKSHTLAFLHELRMFAVSPFTMEEYDAVVQYRRAGTQLEPVRDPSVLTIRDDEPGDASAVVVDGDDLQVVAESERVRTARNHRHQLHAAADEAFRQLRLDMLFNSRASNAESRLHQQMREMFPWLVRDEPNEDGDEDEGRVSATPTEPAIVDDQLALRRQSVIIVDGNEASSSSGGGDAVSGARRAALPPSKHVHNIEQLQRDLTMHHRSSSTRRQRYSLSRNSASQQILGKPSVFLRKSPLSSSSSDDNYAAIDNIVTHGRRTRKQTAPTRQRAYFHYDSDENGDVVITQSNIPTEELSVNVTPAGPVEVLSNTEETLDAHGVGNAAAVDPLSSPFARVCTTSSSPAHANRALASPMEIDLSDTAPTPTPPPRVLDELTIDTDTEDDEVEVLAELKPRHMRTPDIVDIRDMRTPDPPTTYGRPMLTSLPLPAPLTSLPQTSTVSSDRSGNVTDDAGVSESEHTEPGSSSSLLRRSSRLAHKTGSSSVVSTTTPKARKSRQSPRKRDPSRPLSHSPDRKKSRRNKGIRSSTVHREQVEQKIDSQQFVHTPAQRKRSSSNP